MMNCVFISISHSLPFFWTCVPSPQSIQRGILWARPPYFNSQAIGLNFIQCNISHINKPSSPLRYTAADWMFWGGASSHTQRTHRQILFSLGGVLPLYLHQKSDTSHCTHRKDPGIDETFREWKEHEEKKKKRRENSALSEEKVLERKPSTRGKKHSEDCNHIWQKSSQFVTNWHLFRQDPFSRCTAGLKKKYKNTYKIKPSDSHVSQYIRMFAWQRQR